MTLRDRCREFLSQQRQNGIMRVGDPVKDLMDFVETEKGRSADRSLENTKALVLYFSTEQDREGFLALVHEVKPNMITKRMP